MYLFFKICVQQIQTSRRIAVDPAIVVIVAQSYAALPKFVLDKRVRQQIVLRGLELPWRYNRYLQTGAFSLACQLGVERRRSMSPDGLAKMSFLERLEGVVLHNDAARMAQKTVLHFSGLCGMQSSGQPVIVLVDAYAVGLATEDKALLLRLPHDSLSIRFPLKRMQASSRTDELWRAAFVEVALHRDPRSRSVLLTFVDAV